MSWGGGVSAGMEGGMMGRRSLSLSFDRRWSCAVDIRVDLSVLVSALRVMCWKSFGRCSSANSSASSKQGINIYVTYIHSILT